MRRLVLALVGLLVLGGCLAAGALYRRTTQPFKGYAWAEQFVDIERGSGSRAIGQQLVDAGVVRDSITFRAALWLTGLARQLEAGEYRFSSPMTPVAVVEKLARGETYVRLVTFPESLTIPEMAAIFEEQGWGSAAAFVDAAHDASAVAQMDPDARDLEGYLFP